MEGKILFIALILGIVFGSLMLCCLLFVYIKHKKFGFGGFVLTVFGVMLLGFSIWKTAEISVTLYAKIEAKFEALTKRVEDVREITNSTTAIVDEVREIASSATAKVEEIDKTQNLVIREIMNVQGSIIPEGEIEAKFESLEEQVNEVRDIANSTTFKVEEIDQAQNLVIREIMSLQSSMYEIKVNTNYH
jgi:hypothetical protein